MKTQILKPTVLLIVAISIMAFAPTKYLNNIFLYNLKDNLEVYNKKYPEEKTYLQFDKPFYKPGDMIWFKAFIRDGINLQRTQLSEVLYVELIDPKGKTSAKLNLMAVNGMANGNFLITKDMPGGIYKVRAYTKWMMNFDETTFFEKEIQVQAVLLPRLLMKLDFEREAFGAGDKVIAKLELNTTENKPLRNYSFDFNVNLSGKKILSGQDETNNEGIAYIEFDLPEVLQSSDGLLNAIIRYEGNNESISRSIPIILNKISLKFYPEGGNFVSNIINRLAFKALNQYKKPADFEGTVYDNTGKAICKVKSFHQGMGAFEISPEANKNYFLKIAVPEGITDTFHLPHSINNNYAMIVRKQENNMVDVDFYSPIENEINIVLQIRGQIYFSKTLKSTNGMNNIKIPVVDMPAGVAQITLFDEKDIPQCERLVFVNYNRKMNISVTTNKQEYLPRENVEITIKTTDEKGNAIPADLALAVVDDKVISFANDKQHNILSYFLVGADLKGKIHEPNFYFNVKEKKAEQALNYLLMVNGWRRFDWEEVKSPEREIKYYPEKLSTISGIVTKMNGRPAKNAEVILIEETGNKSVLRTRADNKGFFRFNYFVNSNSILLHAQTEKGKWRCKVELTGEMDYEYTNPGLREEVLHDESFNERLDVVNFVPVREEVAQVKENSVKSKKQSRKSKPGISNGSVVKLATDNVGLDEVVVTAYGMSRKKRAIGYAVSDIKGEDIIQVDDLLAGKFAGVQVVKASGSPGASPFIKIRGNASLNNNAGPLYVIDGIPLSEGLSGRTNGSNAFWPDNISNIQVIKGGNATTLYGCRAANGVVIISTKPYQYKNHNRICISNKKSFNTIRVNSGNSTYSRVRKFYSPDYSQDNQPEVRNDFRETIYWNPHVSTNKNGETKVSFYNSDAVTTFRATIEGLSKSGMAGRIEQTWFTRLPFAMSVKIPPYLAFYDSVSIPLILKNNTKDALNGQLLINHPTGLKPVKMPDKQQNIAPGEVKCVFLDYFTIDTIVTDNLSIVFTSNGLQDAITRPVAIQPKGFPAMASFSSQELDKTYELEIKDLVNGSLKAELSVFINPISDMMAGIESILREPYGCFEQTSSSTYPNIMVLNYLNETNTNNPKIRAKAMKLIDKGYKRLVSFETATNGYEWFGASPAHEGLTAYGILEFSDMKKVYGNVCDKMVSRTKDWLLNKRDGKGGFTRKQYALHNFGQISEEVMNAYIVYALTEAGYTDIDKELERAQAEALKSGDCYRMALIANALMSMNEKEAADKTMELIKSNIRKKGFDNLKSDHSITYSMGKSLKIETTALITLALMKSETVDFVLLNEAVNYLIESRGSYGGFGSTQATILALKALSEFAKFTTKTQSPGNIEMYVDENKVASVYYEPSAGNKITIDGLEKFLKEGKQDIKILFTQTNNAMPYSLDVKWTTLTPNSSKLCAVDINTVLSSNEIKTGETVRLKAGITNKTDNGLPMTMAIIGIPSGLTAQPWQLKEIQEKKIADFYEVNKNEVVFYFRGMAPNASREINLDLKAEIPGVYTAPASSAYLYYTNEYKDWSGGEKIVVFQ